MCCVQLTLKNLKKSVSTNVELRSNVGQKIFLNQNKDILQSGLENEHSTAIRNLICCCAFTTFKVSIRSLLILAADYFTSD